MQSAIVDPIHIFNYQNFIIEDSITESQIPIVQKKNDIHQLYFLIKKEEKSFNQMKYSFINHIERSFELIHPSVLNISGYSTEKPYLYYKYVNNPHDINDVKFANDTKVQEILLGIVSALSYLLSKGYSFSTFSIDSIIFDGKEFPRLIDYINYENSKKLSEEELLSEYVKIIDKIVKIRNQDFTLRPTKIELNSVLKQLIENVKQKKEMPTFNDFIYCLTTQRYCINKKTIKTHALDDYLQILQYADRLIYDEELSKVPIKDENNSEDKDKKKDEESDDSPLIFKSIEQICYYLYKNQTKEKTDKNEEYLDKTENEKKNKTEKFKLDNDTCFILNSLPEYYIKSLSQVFMPLSYRMMKYLYYDDLSLVFPEWQKLFNKNSLKSPFKIYNELMYQIKVLENQKNETVYFVKKEKEIEYKIDAIRIQAIHFLKEAAKNTNDAKIKIELAIQYIKGNILPFNLNKALSILKTIIKADRQTKQTVIQMKEKINKAIESTSSNRLKLILHPEQIELFQKAEKGHIFSMLFVAFAFYTGFNEFPIFRSLSIEFYRKAAKKSPDAMTLLGYLYLNGIIFPRNFNRAIKCFRRAAKNGSLKAEIIDGLLRKHLWRNYLVEFDTNDIIHHYLPTFKSVLPNDSFVFPKINYYLDTDLYEENLYKLKLEKEDSKLNSDTYNKNYGSHITYTQIHKWDKQMESVYSKKILLTHEKLENITDSKRPMEIAMNYFYGENGFPVNYSKAAEFFKMAADNGDSEAQWRYALMCSNLLGTKSILTDGETYLKKSAMQNNLRGKFFYAIFLRNRGDIHVFENLIKECCDSGSLDALYYYALHLENDDKTLDKAMTYYQRAADLGHFNSLIRYIGLLKVQKKIESYEEYLNLSVGIMNESLLVKSILFYDKNNIPDQSNILIKIGIIINYQLFNYYHANHLLYGKGMETNLKRAEKFVILAYNDDYSQIYWPKYIYIMLEIFLRRGEDQKAALFLINHKNYITEKYKKKFISFYKKIDRNVANYYFINVDFWCSDYQTCHECLMELRKVKNANLLKAFTDLLKFARKNKNPYAMAIIGKLYKQGKFIFRDLKAAVKYFTCSAENGCPQGYYYLGKEYLYGRFLRNDADKAKELFLAAMKNDGDPRAGYYIYKIPDIRNDENVDDVECLKISASFGYKRALYKYGHRLITGKDDRIKIDKDEGVRLVQKSAFQFYKKAIRYCKLHGYRHEDNSKIKPHYNLSQKEFASNLSLDKSNRSSNFITLSNNYFDTLLNLNKEQNDLVEEEEENSSYLSTIDESTGSIKVEQDSSLSGSKKNKKSSKFNSFVDDENCSYISSAVISKKNVKSNDDSEGEDSSNIGSVKKIKKSARMSSVAEDEKINLSSSKKAKKSAKTSDVDEDEKINLSSSKKAKKSAKTSDVDEDEKINLSSSKKGKKSAKFSDADKDEKISLSSSKRDKKSAKVSDADEDEKINLSSSKKGKKNSIFSSANEDEKSSNMSSSKKGKKSQKLSNKNDDDVNGTFLFHNLQRRERSMYQIKKKFGHKKGSNIKNEAKEDNETNISKNDEEISIEDIPKEDKKNSVVNIPKDEKSSDISSIKDDDDDDSSEFNAFWF